MPICFLYLERETVPTALGSEAHEVADDHTQLCLDLCIHSRPERVIINKIVSEVPEEGSVGYVCMRRVSSAKGFPQQHAYMRWSNGRDICARKEAQWWHLRHGVQKWML